MFIFSVFVIAYLLGVLTAYYKVFPYPHVRNAARTLRTLVHLWRGDEEEYFGEYIETTDIPSGDAPGRRWTILDESVPRLPTIAFGGTNQYLELCPERGCIAVSFDASGKATEFWPFRPADIHAADITGNEYPHEMIGFDPLVNLSPIGVLRYDDGDVLVNFQARGDIFPFGAGIARVDSDGNPRWTRFDYSHHWSSLRADEVAYVPSLKVGGTNLQFTLGSPPSPLPVTLNCSTGHPQLDIIQLTDPSGKVIDEIELVPLFVESNWAGLLPETTDKCDPLHLNYIDEIDADAGPGMAPGDLVISLRNISKFAIVDRSTHEIKRVVSGGFVQQHAVQAACRARSSWPSTITAAIARGRARGSWNWIWPPAWNGAFSRLATRRRSLPKSSLIRPATSTFRPTRPGFSRASPMPAALSRSTSNRAGCSRSTIISMTSRRYPLSRRASASSPGDSPCMG